MNLVGKPLSNKEIKDGTVLIALLVLSFFYIERGIL